MTDTIEALAAALAEAQGEMKNAVLNKTNPHFRSRYADLAAIRDATLPALSKHGLALTQTTQATADGLFLVTRLIHKSGQEISGTYPLPVTGKPQELGSALTYARRYAWSSICGITADEDDDGEAASKAPAGNGQRPAPPAGNLTAAQVAALKAAITKVDADEDLFLKYMKAESLETIPAADYTRAMAALNAKRAAS